MLLAGSTILQSRFQGKGQQIQHVFIRRELWEGIITLPRKIYGNLKTHFMEGVCQSLIHDRLKSGRWGILIKADPIFEIKLMITIVRKALFQEGFTWSCVWSLSLSVEQISPRSQATLTWNEGSFKQINIQTVNYLRTFISILFFAVIRQRWSRDWRTS